MGGVFSVFTRRGTLLIAGALAVLAHPLPAQYVTAQSHYWFTLENGKKLFREGAYGDAIIAFQDARNERREMYSRMESDLIALFSLPEVRRMNDSLDLIENYINEWGHINAEAALAELYYRVGKDNLRNSAHSALNYLDKLKSYPEADYWIGETYRLTGEYEIAIRQFNRALSNIGGTENPGFAVEIIYKIADVERLRQNYNEMERKLLSILADDQLWTQDNNNFAREAMDRTINSSGINRFLQMYRYKNAKTERAHRLLGQYYYASGRHNKAVPHFTFAFLIQNTTIIDEVIAENFDFKFTSLEDLMPRLSRRTAAKEYMKEVDYYKTVYYFAASLYASGKENPARELWSFLAGKNEAGEWQGRARSQLRSPFIEDSLGSAQ
jgi:tetratricopeptide (TPR) repeat protein